MSVGYAEKLTEQRAHAESEAVNAKESLAVFVDTSGKPIPITSQDEYVEVAEFMKQANAKWKFLDEERKISVGPLNEEVKRINGWYAPALHALASIRTQCESIMGTWVLAQRREEQRLMREAEEAAKKVLVTAPGAGIRGSEAMAPTQALVTAAAAAAPAKIEKVAYKPTWRWKVTDVSKLDRQFLMVNEKAINAWIKEHGDKNVPSGVEVEEDVSFTVRK